MASLGDAMGLAICERCKLEVTPRRGGRRRRCAICKRLICRECMERPRNRDEVIMCGLRGDLGMKLPDDCKEPV